MWLFSLAAMVDGREWNAMRYGQIDGIATISIFFLRSFHAMGWDM